MIGGEESLIESRSILAGCHWVPTRASASFRDEVRVTLYRPVSIFQEKRKLAWYVLLFKEAALRSTILLVKL